MTVNLPGLPAELLLKIVECEPIRGKFGTWERRKLFAALRATCREINAKTAYYFGSTYYKSLIVRLQMAGPQVTTFPLARYDQVLSDDESTDSVCSGLEYNHERRSGKPYDRLIFDEGVVNFLMDGTCGDIFSDCLSRLTNVEELSISQPQVNDDVKDDKVRLLELRWSTAVTTLISVALPRISNLKALNIKLRWNLADEREGRWKPLHCSLSLLPVLSSCSRYASHLTTLCLNLLTKAGEAQLQFYAHNLASICNKASELRTLHLALDKTENSHCFFKHFSKKVDLTGLQHLTLRDIITRTKYLKLCLETTKGSLKSIKLEHIEVSTGRWNSMIWFLIDIRLKEVELRCLNWNEGDELYGMSFSDIHAGRPKYFHSADRLLDAEGWRILRIMDKLYSWIKLSAYEGDDICHWLCDITYEYKMCGAWEYIDWNPREER